MAALAKSLAQLQAPPPPFPILMRVGPEANSANQGWVPLGFFVLACLDVPFCPLHSRHVPEDPKESLGTFHTYGIAELTNHYGFQFYYLQPRTIIFI